MAMADDARSRFAVRHPWVSALACECDPVLGRKCSMCRDALLAERGALVERDSVVAYLNRLSDKRYGVYLAGREDQLVAEALADAAALIGEEVHLAVASD